MGKYGACHSVLSSEKAGRRHRDVAYASPACIDRTGRCSANYLDASCGARHSMPPSEWTGWRHRDVAHAWLHAWTEQVCAAEMRREVQISKCLCCRNAT